MKKRIPIKRAEYNSWNSLKVSRIIRFFNDNRPIEFVQEHLLTCADRIAQKRLAKLIDRHNPQPKQPLKA